MNIYESINIVGKNKLIFAAILGALTWLNLIQYVFGDLQLNIIFQYPITWFDKILTIFVFPVELAVIKLIDFFNLKFNLSLELNPLWRPIFFSQWIIIFSAARGIFDSGEKTQALIAALITAFSLLLSVLVIGILPTNSSWWVQGGIAVLPITGTFLGLFIIIFLYESPSNKNSQYFDLSKSCLILSVISFLVGVSSWRIFPVHGSAIIGSTFICLLIAICIYISGIREGFTQVKSKRWMTVGLNVIASAILACTIYILGKIQLF